MNILQIYIDRDKEASDERERLVANILTVFNKETTGTRRWSSSVRQLLDLYQVGVRGITVKD